MPTTSKYLKLGLILAIPVVLGLIWWGFASFIMGGGSSSGTVSDTPTGDTEDIITGSTSPTQPNLGATTYNGEATTITIAVPDWFDTTTMNGTIQALESDKISIKRHIITGANYHDQTYKLMSSGVVDFALIATDQGGDCGSSCGLAFDYGQPIDAFVLGPVAGAIRDPDRTMIPYGIDPIVTYHSPQRKVSGSWSTLFNDILINTTTSSTAGSLPLAIGIGAADKALLRAGKEPYPGYAQILHQILIQFSINEPLLRQFVQLSEGAQLRSYSRMSKVIDTIGEKFPICHETVAACLVRFTVSHYGFGYLTDLMRLPPSWSSTVAFDQFPVETNYYPVRLRGFIVNRQSNSSTTVVGRFISAYVTDMINNPLTTTDSIQLISPFASRFESQGYDSRYSNIMRHTDSFRIIQESKHTALDRARNGGLMAVLDGNSTIQIYLSQRSIR